MWPGGCHDDDEFDIRAQVKIRWGKGKTLDDSAYKTVPFPGLLPTSMALQDTLRLLLTLAMMDDVLMDDIRSWDDLRSLRLPAEVASTGRRLKIRPSMCEVPVLRKMIDHRLTKMPQWTTDMQSEIRRLGQFCGFEETLVAYCMRRGVAYTLATRASEEDRVFLMGHSRQVFPKNKSRISTVDFAAMYRNMPERSVLVQTGISLNRSTEAPTTISDKGRLRVQEDERVKNARQTSDAVRATLRSKHGSLTAAARAGDPQWEEYQAAEAERKAMVNHVSIKIFRTEYKEHFKSLGFTKAALLQLDDAITEVATTSDGVQSDADVSDLPLFVAEDEDIDAYDAVLNTRNAEETPSTEEQEELEDLFGDSTGLDIDITDNIQSAEEIDTTLDDSRQMALHGQSLDNLRSLKKYAQSTKGHSAYNDMVEDVSACETEGQNREECTMY
ncbi:uncharacterized protein J4E78_010781 [Alternaria triticimaculans]|uniref:uncharacterized protein n=1 Tax=Alternaria triticimaculans TaxID=297637 RepID=UPI0020C46EF5|nr:uncharacterized protein J4E78_010781 [Alternaria triticimaculans]KAI4639879.1 hypothetical protein J4E78_010781 [Alternaria triticimaculans]